MHIKGRKKLRFILVLTGCAIFLLCGLWYMLKGVRWGTSQPIDQTSSIEPLKSLPYVTWTPIDEQEAKKTGVTKYNPKLSYKGINLYYTENKPGGHFFDMFGNVLHTFSDKRNKYDKWQFIEPYTNNNFLVIIQCKALFMIDWDSDIKWEVKGTFHHDISIADDGSIYTVMNGKVLSPKFCTKEPIRNDWLVILTKDGKIKRRISFAKMISQNKVLFDAAVNQSPRKYNFGPAAWDIFHTNTVEIIDRDVFSKNKKLFKKGDVLFCMRNMNLIGVIDVEEEKIVWSWGMNELECPHHPSLLKNGNILIFDNGLDREYSRVIELNPITEEIEWEYKGDPPKSFWSSTRGSAQRLPNGNTLIAESDRGRVFEITRDGEILWEFYNPEVGEFYDPDHLRMIEGTKIFRMAKTFRRATIYRMMRITDPERYPMLKKLK